MSAENILAYFRAKRRLNIVNIYCVISLANFRLLLLSAILRGSPISISPMVSFLGFLATFICFCVTVLFYHYLYFVVNRNKNVSAGRGQGVLPYMGYSWNYVRSLKVWYFGHFGQKWAIDIGHFSPSNIELFLVIFYIKLELSCTMKASNHCL